jgi:hypothetical protein
MKKIVLRDLEAFNIWQARISQGVDDKGQISVSTMAQPAEYPVLIVWSFHEEPDIESAINVSFDKFEYKFVYIGDFPIKCLKRGTYVYQVFQTSDVCEV